VADLKDAYRVDFSDRVVLAPHGTSDPFEIAPQRRLSRASRQSKFEVAFVGRFEPRKGFEVAVKAIHELLMGVPGASAKFVGDALTDETRVRLSELGVQSLLTNPRVEFLGVIPRQSLDDLYATIDAVIMPSRYESFGLVAIEAMAAGAVVIASASGGLAEVVKDGATGYLVPVNAKEAELASSLLVKLANNEPLRRRLSENARSDFESRFTVAGMAEKAEFAYRRAVSRRLS